MDNGLIGNFETNTKFRTKERVTRISTSVNSNARYKCGKCNVTTDDEKVINNHIWNDNDCTSKYYTDKELTNNGN